MGLSILIVNYNTEQFIVNFLHGLTKQTIGASCLEVIIVNNSNNNAMQSLIEQNDLNLNLNIQVMLSENIGFGRAMNVAASVANQPHLLIANPDLVLLDHHYLQELLIQAESHPQYGAITTQLLDEKQQDLSEFYNYEFHETFGFENQICWFSGALLLIHSEIYQQIGGFDPDFFMYCEDEDICLRIKQHGLPLIKLNHLQISHIGGASEPNLCHNYFCRWYRSQILFAYKHMSADAFNQLITKLQRKSRSKCMIYQILKPLGIARYTFKLTQWKAMAEVIKKTQYESTAWLKYTPK